ncbi:MAG: divalent metal cation transporter [Candidatus Levybacteria bacterium]|nr:divalent metal cation transporter [Candidatus Levybacteria bacterium]
MNDSILEKAVENIISAPAVVLDKTISGSQSIATSIMNHEPVKKAGDYWERLGPGLTTGAADDDPSGVATYSQAGAQFGFQLIWLAPFTFPLMAIVQEMCARIGLVTGRGLAGNIRIHYSRWILYLCSMLLFITNTFNIGVDIGAMAKAVQLIIPNANFVLILIIFTSISLGLQIFITYDKYAKYLKFLALLLLSYVFSALYINMDWGMVIKNAVIPSIVFSKDQFFLICAILGTTISPYLFFWQTSQEVEEEILNGKTTIKLRQETTSKKNIHDMRIDVWSGMFISNLVMFFIIATCAATLFANGITTITTAADAAIALRPIAGEQAYLLFALGIIGTGLLALPILAGSASYALSESFKWRHGLFRKLKDAYAFYGVIIFSMIIGLLINFLDIDPIKALIYSAVINGLVAPIILILIVQISSNNKIMGDKTNHPATTIIGWFVIGLMLISGAATLVTLIR